MKPELSIIIPTLGFESIFATLDSVIKNTKNNKTEIIVIGNVDERIEKYKKVVRHFPAFFEKGDLSRKRNLGLEKAKAEIVAFIDDDVLVTESWIDNGLRHFKDEKVGIVSGPGIIPKKAGFFTELFGITLSSLGAFPVRKRYIRGKKLEEDFTGEKIIGCNMFIRKKVYEDIGGFNPDIIPAEEIDFASRAIKKGYKVYMDSDAYLIHFARSGVWKFFKQIFRFGKSKINSVKREIIPVKMVYFLPLASILLIFLLTMQVFFLPQLANIFLVFYFLYFSFVLISTMLAVIETCKLKAILLIITIPLMHLAYGIGELYEFFSVKNPVLKHRACSGS